MATINTIAASDNITDSRTTINDNFTALNTDKIETSVIDTDTALTANSDAKIPSQKAVKAYVDGVGVANASTTVRGVVEEATAAQVLAGTAAGETGARLFINPSTFPTLTPTRTIATGSATRDLSLTTGTQTIAHGLGVAPTYISMKARTSESNSFCVSWGEWYAGGYYSAIAVASTEGGSSASEDDEDVGTTWILKLADSGANDLDNNYQIATIAVDATNITITWTLTGTVNETATFVWLAKVDAITKS